MHKTLSKIFNTEDKTKTMCRMIFLIYSVPNREIHRDRKCASDCQGGGEGNGDQLLLGCRISLGVVKQLWNGVVVIAAHSATILKTIELFSFKL